jgi:hypothetical protein
MVTIPNGVLYYAPITLTYYYNEVVPHVEIDTLQNITTTYTTTNATMLGTTYQQQLFIPMNNSYSTTANSDWSNVVFFDVGGNLLPSWIENFRGIGTGGTTALVWVKNAGFSTNSSTVKMTVASTTQSQSNLITVYTTTYSTTNVITFSSTMYIGFQDKRNFLFNSGGTTGCNYLLKLGLGGVDNGKQVFNYYGGFEVQAIPFDWLMMFIYKPEFPSDGGVLISSLGGWQGYVTSYQTKVPEILECMFNSGTANTAALGVVQNREAGINQQPVDLSDTSFDNPVGNLAPTFTLPTRGFMQMEFNVGGYFGEWCIKTSNMQDHVCAGYAFNGRNYVMSLFVTADKLQGQSNYGNVNMTSQSTRQTTGIPFFEVNVPGQSGFLDFGNFSGSNTQFFWLRTREYVQQQPSAVYGVLSSNVVAPTYTLSFKESLGVN